MDGLELNMAIHPFCGKFGLTTVSLRVQDLLNYTKIDPMVQRKLSSGQRRKIAKYLQERELDHVFFGPVTLSLRDVSSLGRDDERLYLRHGSKLSILDGQHRILALGYVNEQLQKEVRRYERTAATLKIKRRKFPDSMAIVEELEQVSGMLEQLEKRRLKVMETKLAVQIYIGLSEEEEKQLFGDINSKVQLVSKELGHSFDSTDPLNLVIQQVVEHNIFLKAAGVEKTQQPHVVQPQLYMLQLAVFHGVHAFLRQNAAILRADAQNPQRPFHVCGNAAPVLQHGSAFDAGAAGTGTIHFGEPGHAGEPGAVCARLPVHQRYLQRGLDFEPVDAG